MHHKPYVKIAQIHSVSSLRTALIIPEVVNIHICGPPYAVCDDGGLMNEVADVISQLTKLLLKSASGPRFARIKRVASAGAHPSLMRMSAVTSPERVRPAWHRMSTRSPFFHWA